MGIEIIYALKDASSLKTSFSETSASFKFLIENGQEYEINLDLFDEINPEKCVAKVQLTKIEITMEKKIKNKSWGQLENAASSSEKAQ